MPAQFGEGAVAQVGIVPGGEDRTSAGHEGCEVQLGPRVDGRRQHALIAGTGWRAGRQLVGFSATLQAEERQLKAVLYRRMYEAEPVMAVRAAAQDMLAGLFAAYLDDPRRLPEEWRPDGDDPVTVLRAIGDFIAGMTDRYAIRRYEELVGPADLPEGF